MDLDDPDNVPYIFPQQQNNIGKEKGYLETSEQHPASDHQYRHAALAGTTDSELIVPLATSNVHSKQPLPSTDKPKNSCKTLSEASGYSQKRARDNVRGVQEAAKRRERKGDLWNKCLTAQSPEHIVNIGPPCKCGCFSKLGSEIIARIFLRFWEMNEGEQDAYLHSLMKSREVHRVLLEDGRVCKLSIVSYFVSVYGKIYNMCTSAFHSIHGITEARMQDVLAQVAGNGTRQNMKQVEEPVIKSEESDEGSTSEETDEESTKSDGEVTKPEELNIELEDHAHVIEHINSLAVVSSQCTRSKNPSRSYLIPGLQMNSVYLMYCSWLQANYHDSEPVPQDLYIKVFKKDFCISLEPPRIDICDKCEKLSKKVWSQSRRRDTFHLIRAMNSKEVHAKLMTKALFEMLNRHRKNNDLTKVAICMDLQQALATPRIFYEAQYYKKKLWTYNFGIHNLRTGKASMYIWSEAKANRGSAEIASCLLHYINTQVCQPTTKLTIFSDSCSSHNKNINLVLTCLRLIHERKFQDIEHFFMMPGHSNLPCNRHFSFIENSFQQQPLYTPDQYAEHIANSKLRRPFTVIKMGQDDFLDVSVMQDAINQRDAVAHSIKDGRVFLYSDSYKEGFAIKPTYSATDTYRIKLQKGKCDPGDSNAFNLATIKLPRKYTKSLKLSTEKVDDIKALMQYVPEEHLEFFEDLLRGQHDAATIIEETAPDDDMLDYLPSPMPGSHSEISKRAGPTLGEERVWVKLLPAWDPDEDVEEDELFVKEEVMEEPFEDQVTADMVTLEPTTDWNK